MEVIKACYRLREHRVIEQVEILDAEKQREAIGQGKAATDSQIRLVRWETAEIVTWKISLFSCERGNEGGRIQYPTARLAGIGPIERLPRHDVWSGAVVAEDRRPDLGSNVKRRCRIYVQHAIDGPAAQQRVRYRAIQLWCHKFVGNGPLQAHGENDPATAKARHLARIDETDRAISALSTTIDRGFLCASAISRDPWFDPLRSHPCHVDLMQDAERRRIETHAAFLAAGGEQVISVA